VIIAWFFGFLTGMGVSILVVGSAHYLIFRPEPDEVWCGCDGEGMAHIPGGKGFPCEDERTQGEAVSDYRAIIAKQEELARLNPPTQPVEARPYDMDREVRELKAMIDAMPDDPPAKPEGGESA